MNNKIIRAEMLLIEMLKEDRCLSDVITITEALYAVRRLKSSMGEEKKSIFPDPNRGGSSCGDWFENAKNR